MTMYAVLAMINFVAVFVVIRNVFVALSLENMLVQTVAAVLVYLCTEKFGKEMRDNRADKTEVG